MHAFHTAIAPTSYANSIDHNARVQSAITNLELQEVINYAATTKKWKIDRSTLSRRYRGKTGLNQDATSYSRK